jgi:hypothetical protein
MQRLLAGLRYFWGPRDAGFTRGNRWDAPWDGDAFPTSQGRPPWVTVQPSDGRDLVGNGERGVGESLEHRLT